MPAAASAASQRLSPERAIAIASSDPKVRPLLLANPMTGPLQLARFAIFGEADAVGTALAVTGVWILGLTVATILAFRRHERVAMDRL